MATNTIKDADLAAKAADVEFTRAFEEDTRKLAQILGVFEPVRRAPNTALKYYETSGALEGGAVAEGEDILVRALRSRPARCAPGLRAASQPCVAPRCHTRAKSRRRCQKTARV